MQINLHGALAEDFGPVFRIEAETIADAIKGLSMQLPFYKDRILENRPTIRIMEIDDPREMFQKTELKEIHLVPAMIGGGGVGKILVGAALIAFAIINPFSIPLAGFGLAALSAMVTVGATLVLNGAMQLFMKAPTVTKTGSKDPEQSKYMGLGGNTVAIGTPIPIQYGRGPVTGHLLAVNVDAAELITGTFPDTTS